ncbi:hypothetical protein SLEP1_g4571 [Rubroshorea leprosula]|uniref:alcohol dehydrogenase n=1 Tax=Rubroshorea leprosula TaxID=152421 RepID=A0AAV5HYV8_9ROSI|nr:hypothetical protein SLEP1_g4571 [Rubroshorea leprosula]
MYSISVSSELTTTGSFCKPPISLHRFSFPFLRYPFANIPKRSPATAIHARKRDPRSQPVLKPSIVEDVSMGDEEDDEEEQLLFDDSKDGIDASIEEDDYVKDEYVEAEKTELYVGDGAGGGGIESSPSTILSPHSLHGAERITEAINKPSSTMSTAGQVIRCKAAVAWEAGKPLVIEEVEVAPPQRNEVRVKILYTSLCHTDVYFWEAKGQNPLFPRILGHEAGGIVESVGEGVTDLQPGDHVLPIFTGECKECPHCKSEESNMCDLLRINTDRGSMINDGKSRFSIDGQPIHHFLGTSTFSEYTVVHVGQVAKINPAAPLDKVCVLSCGISTGFGATVNVAKPKKGHSVAIFGLGAVGLAAAEGARFSGASRIIGVDLNASRFEEAKKFGVTEFVNPKDHDKPVQQVIAEMTNGGVDRSVECTGSIQAMISAFECVHDGWGVAVLVGVPSRDDSFKTSPVNFLNERTLKGTFFGNYKPRTDIPKVVEQYMNKGLELEKLEMFITHSVPFSEINKAFEYMLSGQGLRCIIRMEH